MSDELVDRVAQALCDVASRNSESFTGAHFRRMARAAIGALQLKPNTRTYPDTNEGNLVEERLVSPWVVAWNSE